MSSKLSYEKQKEMFTNNDFPINVSSLGGWYNIYANADTVDLTKGDLVQIDTSTNSVIRTKQDSVAPYNYPKSYGIVLDTMIPVGEKGKVVFQGVALCKTEENIYGYDLVSRGVTLGNIQAMSYTLSPSSINYVGYLISTTKINGLYLTYLAPKQ